MWYVMPFGLEGSGLDEDMYRIADRGVTVRKFNGESIHAAARSIRRILRI